MKINILSILFLTIFIAFSSCKNNKKQDIATEERKDTTIQVLNSNEHVTSKPIDLNGIPMHFRGNLKSEITLWFISDYYCEFCRDFEPLFYMLYNKYKTKIRFGHFNLSMDSPLKGIAAECAAKQDKYWEMDELLYNLNIADTTDIISVASDIGMDITQFNFDIRDSNIIKKYEDAKNQILNKGIQATPSIIINSRLFENPDNISEIERYIEQLL